MESPTKQYKSIEASVFAIDAHYGEGKDVKYWRSKMRRLCAKYRQELSELKIQVNTLKQGEKQYVEKLFPYYVRILEDIAKLREKLADLQFVKKFIKSTNINYNITLNNIINSPILFIVNHFSSTIPNSYYVYFIIIEIYHYLLSCIFLYIVFK